MKQKLSAPLASVIASLFVVGWLYFLTPTIQVPGLEPLAMGNVLSYLYGDVGILETDLSLHILLSSVVIWVSLFSICWLILSLVSRD